MVTTIPTVSYSGTDPDPVEWANDFVKPAITELQSAGGGGGSYQAPKLTQQVLAAGSNVFITAANQGLVVCPGGSQVRFMDAGVSYIFIHTGTSDTGAVTLQYGGSVASQKGPLFLSAGQAVAIDITLDGVMHTTPLDGRVTHVEERLSVNRDITIDDAGKFFWCNNGTDVTVNLVPPPSGYTWPYPVRFAAIGSGRILFTSPVPMYGPTAVPANSVEPVVVDGGGNIFFISPMSPRAPNGSRVRLTNVGATGNLQGGYFNASPIFMRSFSTWNEVSVEVAAASAEAVSLALYYTTASGAVGYLLHTFGTVDAATTGIKSLTGSWPVPAGTYYLVANPATGNAVFNCQTSSSFADMLCLNDRTVTGGRYLVGGGGAGAPFPGSLSGLLVNNGEFPCFGIRVS